MGTSPWVNFCGVGRFPTKVPTLGSKFANLYSLKTPKTKKELDHQIADFAEINVDELCKSGCSRCVDVNEPSSSYFLSASFLWGCIHTLRLGQRAYRVGGGVIIEAIGRRRVAVRRISRPEYLNFVEIWDPGLTTRNSV